MTTNGIIKARPSAYNLVDPKAVKRREGWNPRFDFGEIEELAKSIKYQAAECGVPGGLLNPIRVQRAEEGFLLIDGDRRLTAVEQLLAWHAAGDARGHDFAEGIPAFVVGKDQNEIVSLIQMFEANSGKPFLPLEEAQAYKRLRDQGLTLEEIAKAVGRNHLHVNNTLALLEAGEELQSAVASGKVGGTMAKKIAVATRGDKKKAAELTKKAVEAGADKTKKRQVVKEVEQARVEKAAAKGKTLKVKPLDADDLSALGEKMAKQLNELLGDTGFATEEGLLAAVAGDAKMAAAFTLGAFQALKAAAGMKINLKV